MKTVFECVSGTWLKLKQEVMLLFKATVFARKLYTVRLAYDLKKQKDQN